MKIKMAWRSIFRSKRRSLITSFTVALGLLLSVTFTASGDYSYTNIINTSAKMGYGHISVTAKGYNDNPSIRKRVDSADTIAGKIELMEGVDSVNVRIVGQAMFASAGKSVSGIFIGIEPEHEKVEQNIFMASINEGEQLKEIGGRGVVIGSKMADKLNLKLGRKLIYTFADVHGEIVSEIARVKGIFKTGVAEVDGGFVLLPIDRVRNVAGYTKNQANVITVTLGDQRQTDDMIGKIRAEIKNDKLDILSWRKTQPDMAGLVALDKTTNHMFQFLVGLLISAGILNTILMSVLERKHEFGILLAIGTSPLALFEMVMLESLFIGLIGLVTGVVITTPWFYYMAHHGLDLSTFIEDGADIGGVLVDPILKFRLYFKSGMYILSGLLLLTMFAGLYPAIKAGRLTPVDSIKEV